MAKILNMSMGEIVKAIGMKRVLESLIELLDTDEDYVKQLKADLEVTLKNYEARHDNEE